MSKWPDVIRGCAYGDAWGAGNEFHSYEELTRDNPMGPELPEKLIVTDDTQMTLYLARALNKEPDDRVLRTRIADEFVNWLNDPENYRSPGATCLEACRRLMTTTDWKEATVINRAGCGVVMRVSPCAFLGEERWIETAAYQAALTHGHFTAIAAAVITAAVIRLATDGDIKPGTATSWAYRVTEDHHAYVQRAVEWLHGHPSAADEDDLHRQLRRGFQACADYLARARDALQKFRDAPWADDPCAYGGEGWTAPDCLATALLCVDTFPDDPIVALRRATVTDGDSDSIAAVAGAILGALHDDPWPAEWQFRLEPQYMAWIREADNYAF